ncbi:MAG: hypothetical protein ABH875_07460 [Candidatus Omnitrophota bacterium]
MTNTFGITVLLIALVTIIGAFIKGRSRDRCLVDFNGFPVTIEMRDGKDIWGNMSVEPTGIELIYKEDYLDEKDGHIEKSYIFYKNDFPAIGALVRYEDALDQTQKKKREKILKKYYTPSHIHSLGRKAKNIFSTVRDSLMELSTLLIGRVRSVTPIGAALSGQDKYVSQLQQQLVPTGYAFEPILEKHIGRKVILSFNRKDKKEEYLGILKEYTTDFVEIIDVSYKKDPAQAPKKADIIASRQIGIIRHLGK